MKNFQAITDSIFSDPATQNARLLLHACCGPCATYVLPYVNTVFNTTVFYYNPSIMPENEYLRRAESLKKVVSAEMKATNLIIANYDSTPFTSAVNGLETAPEGGERCAVCFAVRLEETARYAKEHGFLWFGTTLSVSPHKNATLINAIGEKLAEQYGLHWLYADFKKKDGHKISVERSNALDLYRQNYCGCLFSKII